MAGKKSHGKAWRVNNERWRELIADHEAFVNPRRTLEGYYVDGMTEDDAPATLTGADLERFLEDAPFIVYVVMSYGTPIYWLTMAQSAGNETGYAIVSPPSKTTAGHRNLCPGYTPVRGNGWVAKRMPDGTRRRIRKETT